MGLRKTAGNAAAQNDHDGLRSAIKIHETDENIDETATRYLADVLRTSRPVITFVKTPQTTVGRSRREVWSGDWFCIS
jgi:hypothetical protein